MMRPTTTTGRIVYWSQRGVLHAALIAGSILFSIPFLWLFSTSAKVPDEMYPPRWIPEIPSAVDESPYIHLREQDAPEQPPMVEDEAWEARIGPMVDAVGAAIAGLDEALPDFYRPYLDHPDVARAVVARLLLSTPDEQFERPPEEAAANMAARVTPPIVMETFNQVYRRVAVDEIVVRGWDVFATERPMREHDLPWRVAKGDAALIDRFEGLPRPAQEVRYSFEDTGEFVLTNVIPVDMELSPEVIKRFIVSLHGDRSWHHIIATVEMAGRKWVASEPGFLQSDRWQDITWQFRSEEDDSLKTKTWRTLDEAGASEFDEPGQVRVTLRFNEDSTLMATVNKYVNNYREVLRMAPLGTYFRNSAILVVMNIAGQILGSALVAYAFARLRWPGRDAYFLIVLATLMIPPMVVMIPQFLIFKFLGWYNTLLPLWVFAWCGSPFFIFLLRQFMKGIPRDLEDSAKIDGCGYFGIWWRIILPLVKPALAAISIMTFITVWNEFMGPLIYLNDQRLYPLSLGLFALQVFQGGNYGLMMAASIMMTLPVIILFFIAQRQFIQGITLTGMKG